MSSRAAYRCEWTRRGDNVEVLIHQRATLEPGYFATEREARQAEADRMRRFAEELACQASHLDQTVMASRFTGD